MSIQLGLGRINRLLQDTKLPWKAVHVAGTNGKGSICAYVHSLLRADNIATGRFVSPFLIDPWDCIYINDAPIKPRLYHSIIEQIRLRDREQKIGASPFEILTATTFEAFTAQHIKVGVVEVGLGGRLDATNVFVRPRVTVISKIGLDHQQFLGETLREIATEKAGIIKKDTPCVVDASNDPEVLAVTRETAQRLNAPYEEISPAWRDGLIWKHLERSKFEPHQQENIALACAAVEQVLARRRSEATLEQLLPAIEKIVWPGRLQSLCVHSLTNRTAEIILDGAHNTQSAGVLSQFVQEKIRGQHKAVTWLLAVSDGKDSRRLFKTLVQAGDTVVVTEFGQVQDMPWIRPLWSHELAEQIRETVPDVRVYEEAQSVNDALEIACDMAKEGPLVVTGSLYLVSDILRSLRSIDQHRAAAFFI